MKIKSIAAICKKNKNIAIFERYSDDGDILTQYIGDGSAVYPVVGLPQLDKESLLTIFDVPEKDRDNYFVKTLGVPAGISFEDTDETERHVEREGISIIYSGRTLKPIRTTRGLVFIESRYLSPVADVLDVLELYERRTAEGAPYIVAKAGFLLQAVIMPYDVIEAFCTANAIKYLWRWKLKNGEEDLQKAVWYINRLIQRAGADSAAGKELFNMKENKHGFEPKQEFTMGGIAWTVIQTGADWVKCIASDCVEERAFDEGNKNDFAASSLRAYLNGEFLRRLIKAGAPEEMFEYFNIDLTADDGLKNYGGDRVRIGLITCEEYRLLRGNIPALPDCWWWTATPDSPVNSFVRCVYSGGSLYSSGACDGLYGVRPLCNLKSEILVSYLNGENAEEQKKRAEAVDMMKHIAAAWDIDAEEVFGRADE